MDSEATAFLFQRTADQCFYEWKGKSMKIVCFGDSLTSCGGPGGRYSDILQDRFPSLRIINRGIGGQTLVDAKERLASDVLAEKPDAVLLEYGANDWWRDERPPAAWAADLAEIIEQIQAIGAKVAVLGVFGSYRDPVSGELREKVYGIDERARAYRDLERALAERYGCPYVANIQQDIIDDRCCWGDGNHPNEHGNRRVADQIAPILTAWSGCQEQAIRKQRLRTTRDFWDEAVALAPAQLAAVCGERRLSYAEADRRAGELAVGLQRASGKTRPMVAVCLPNGLEYFLLYWALVKIGAVIVPINPWLKEDSLDAILNTVEPDLLIVQGRGDKEVLACVSKRPPLPLFSVEKHAEFADFASLFMPGEAPLREELAEDAPSIIMHTSGTTAAPKGAVMRHNDLIYNVMTTINAQGFQRGDVHLLVNPMFHCTALYSSLPAAAHQHCPVIITAETQPDALLSLIQRERITTFLTVPAILQRVVAQPNIAAYELSCLRVIGYAGSFMPVKTVRRLQELFPEVALHNFFGLTETISATHVLHGDASLERPDSIGRTLPFVTARIVNDEGQECAPDEVGELLFARENVISGYWRQPGRLEEALVELDGRCWFRTGDLASKDADGYTFIKGRKKDMIIVGGENVFAAEVEAALMLLDKVKEAAVKGVPATGVRESLGELIKAYVVAEAGSDLSETDLRRHCHKVLPSYKIPHLITFMEALPRNPAGKVQKNELA
jgi:acyl-CoA synthetase (AMP-forming)/AMP-acid ligase II/lysophospholipase L1-like esterase